MKVINNTDRIESLLLQKPHLRDDDNALIASIWWIEAQKKLDAAQFEQIKPFLRLVANGEISNAKTICRSRAVMQKLKPELRGEKYAKRQGKEQAEAKADLEAFKIHEQTKQISLGI